MSSPKFVKYAGVVYKKVVAQHGEDLPGAKYAIALGAKEEEVLASLHEGQSDPVYAVVSRNITYGVTWVTESELDAVVTRLAQYLGDEALLAGSDEEEIEAAASMLYEFENMLQGKSGIEYPPGIIKEFDLSLPKAQ